MRTIIPVVVALTLSCGFAIAETDQPAKLQGVTTVDLAAVKKAVADKSALLVDFRPADKFAAGTIPGAVNCPGIQQQPTNISAGEIDKARSVIAACPALSGAGKSKEIIAFCSHVGCWLSTKAAAALAGMGYSNVKWFRGGYDDWKGKGKQS